MAMVLFMDDWYAYLTGTYGAVMVRKFPLKVEDI